MCISQRSLSFAAGLTVHLGGRGTQYRLPPGHYKLLPVKITIPFCLSLTPPTKSFEVVRRSRLPQAQGEKAKAAAEPASV